MRGQPYRLFEDLTNKNSPSPIHLAESMEIPAWWISSFGVLLSATFLHLGFYALHKTHLSNSVSPLALFFFNHSLAISSCTSSTYALLFRQQRSDPVDARYFWIAGAILPFLISSTVRSSDEKLTMSLCLLSYALIKHSWLYDFVPVLKNYYWLTAVGFVPLVWLHAGYALVFTLIHFFVVGGLLYDFTPAQKAGIAIHIAVGTSLFFTKANNFLPIVVLFVSFFNSAFLAAVSDLQVWIDDELPWAERFKPAGVKSMEIFSNLREKKLGKMVEFGIGLVGTLLFQYFFRLTAFSEVVAFLSFAAMWVVNLSLLGVSRDLGVLNFLLGNVVVGCTVSQFGLRSTTWVAYGASVVLYGLRLKLESLTLAYRGHDTISVGLWFKVEPFRLPV